MFYDVACTLRRKYVMCLASWRGYGSPKGVIICTQSFICFSWMLFNVSESKCIILVNRFNWLFHLYRRSFFFILTMLTHSRKSFCCCCFSLFISYIDRPVCYNVLRSISIHNVRFFSAVFNSSYRFSPVYRIFNGQSSDIYVSMVIYSHW